MNIEKVVNNMSFNNETAMQALDSAIGNLGQIFSGLNLQTGAFDEDDEIELKHLPFLLEDLKKVKRVLEINKGLGIFGD